MKLRVEDMAISFDNRRILEHVGFHVEEGEFTALIGPSGCGKSTLLNILAGLLDCEEGTFYVDDVQVSGVSSHFAYMPQDDLLLPWKNILDNVCLYGKLHGHVKEAREQALQEFEAFGLKGYEQAYPYELSGGMRQRAAFLRTALCRCVCWRAWRSLQRKGRNCTIACFPTPISLKRTPLSYPPPLTASA